MLLRVPPWSPRTPCLSQTFPEKRNCQPKSKIVLLILVSLKHGKIKEKQNGKKEEIHPPPSSSRGAVSPGHRLQAGPALGFGSAAGLSASVWGNHIWARDQSRGQGRRSGHSVLVCWQPKVKFPMWTQSHSVLWSVRKGLRPGVRATESRSRSRVRLLSTDAPAGAGRPGSPAPLQGQASPPRPQWACHS